VSAVLTVFEQTGAYLKGHFRLTSGLHSDEYLQCALVLQHPAYAESLGRAIGEWARALTPTAVLSPALGGVVIGQEVGRALGVRAIFAERQDGQFTLRRGFTLDQRERVLGNRATIHARRMDDADIPARRRHGVEIVDSGSGASLRHVRRKSLCAPCALVNGTFTAPVAISSSVCSMPAVNCSRL
jgi:orotate phosphoribosyltransferase